MYGDITCELTTTALAFRLRDAGIGVQIRRWLYGNGGPYIHVRDADDFTLSRVGRHRYHADAICASFERMRSTTSLVSAALTHLEIRHRFHVFDGRVPYVDYFHHDWPIESANQCPRLYRAQFRT